MKRLWLFCLMLLALCAPAPGGAASSPLTIAVAADLHVNPASQTKNPVNPLEPCHMGIVDAFLCDVVARDADVLLLLGDITNQGRAAQHEALLTMLRKAQKSGLVILALPGNHDIGEVDPTGFAGLYQDFGYGRAYSRDDASLSYSVLLDSRLFLLLDTNGYSGQRDSAFLTDTTLNWMERQLALAREKGWQVIAAGHYPLCTSHSTPFTNGERAARLLEAYGAPLYLCGHLHKRCVTVQGGLTELVVDQTIAYPCAYAMLTLDADGGIEYQPQRIDVSGWARQSGITDPNLLDFDAYQARLERERCVTVVDKIRRDQQIDDASLHQAEDFFIQFSECRAQGTVSRYADALRSHPGYDILIRLSEGTIYQRWIPSVIADAVPYTTGFTLRDGQIVATDP